MALVKGKKKIKKELAKGKPFKQALVIAVGVVKKKRVPQRKGGK